MKHGKCKISKSARGGLQDAHFAASLLGSPSRQIGLGLEAEEPVGCGPPGNWQGCHYSETPTLPKTFQEATHMQAIRPPPGLTDIDPIKPSAKVSIGIAQGGSSMAGAPFDLETYAAGLAAATQPNVRIKLRTPPPGRGPAAPVLPQPRRAAPLSAPVSPQPRRPQASSADPMQPGLGIFSFADCMFGQEQRPQIPAPTSQPPVRPEAQEPCKVLRMSSAEPVKVAQVSGLRNDNMSPNSANDFATTSSANDFLWPKQDDCIFPPQGRGSYRTYPSAAATGLPSSASSMNTVQLYSPQVAESQRVLTGAIEGLQHSLEVMQQSFVDLQRMLGQPPPDCALPAAGAVEEPEGGAGAAAQAIGVTPLGPPPRALHAPIPMALRALLWCSRSTRDWGDDSPQKSELLSGLCAEACGLRINNFPSATQFSRWLFVQERGPDVAPSSILIVGWREAKPCVKAVDAAVTGKDDTLRDDARRVLRKANEGPGDVRVLVGMVIILAEHDATVERASEFLDCRYAELDEEDVPFVVPVKVARTPSELRALLNDAAQGKAGHADVTVQEAKPADKDCVGAEAAVKVSAQKLPLSSTLKAFPAPLETASLRL